MQTEKDPVETPLDVIDLLRRFGKTLRRFWLLVIVLGLLCSGVWYVRAARSFSPYYTARAVFTVSSGYGDDIFNSGYYDNATAQQLAAAFPYMLNTDVMRDLMKQELGTNYINGSISASSTANTNMFVLQVRSASAQDAYDILVAAITCFPQVAVYMVDNPQIIVREEPQVPTEPSNSFSWKQPVMKGLMVGLVLGLAIVAALTMLNKTVSTEEQLKAVANLPILAVFPKIQTKKRRSGTRQVLTAGSDHSLAESLRGMTLKVRKILEEQQNKVILITSTMKGEGKTTVATNLALALAGEGQRVVLLDADLRSQSVAQRFGNAPGRYGLIDCLKNPKLPVGDCLTWVREEKLAYISGASVSSRRYSIDGKGMRRVLDELSGAFDYVIMDTSPCGLVADTALLCHFAGCVLYVVKPDYARESQILDMVNGLYERGAPLEGFVFNGVNRRGSRYGYGYGYGYKYGYGYSQKSKGGHYGSGK